MGASSGIVLEITVISCENLRVMEDPYVVVRAESLNCCTTKMAKDSGSNKTSLFSWNEKLMLNMPMHAWSTRSRCNAKGSRVFDRLGWPESPCRIFSAAACREISCTWSYRLKDWEGKENGVIHFAVRVEVAPVKGTVVSKVLVMVSWESKLVTSVTKLLLVFE